MSIRLFDSEALTDLVFAHTGRNPQAVWNQGLLICARFDTGEVGVWRIETLEAHLS